MGARTTFFGYRLLSRFAEVLPARAITPVSRFAGRVAVKRLPEKRALVTRNLERVTGSAPSRHLIEDAFTSYVRYWLESLRLPVVPRERLDNMFVLGGSDHLDAALAQGKGAILALPHFGNWDVAGAWLVTHGYPLMVVVERIEPPELFTWFEDFRISLGFEVVVNDDRVSSKLLKALADNKTIALLCDRDVDGTGAPFEFFGEVTNIPRGPATLALRSGAALLPVAVYENRNDYRAEIQPALPVVREGKLSEDVNRITASLLRVLERLIRNAPSQWHLFQPNWPSDRELHREVRGPH